MKKRTQIGVCLGLLLGSMLVQAQEYATTSNVVLNKVQLQLTQGSSSYNPQAGIATLQELALQGNAKAMNALGLVYSKGLGVAINEPEAIVWLQKAADKGYAKAWYNLGVLYNEGLSNNQNPTKALACFEKAATLGYDYAYEKWAYMEAKGIGTPQNYQKAIRLYQLGAEKGLAHCNYYLGYLQYKGLGCPQDYAKAITQFELAAQKNDPWAMYMLGLCHRNGYGTTINLEKAKDYLTQAAALAVKPAQMELDDAEAENAKPKQAKTVSKNIPEVITITETEAPDSFIKVKQQPITHPIGGNYTGYLLRYDWSGQNLLSTTPLKVSLTQNGNKLEGEWQETAGDTCLFKASIQDNAIVFENSTIDRTEHFYKGSLNTYSFKDAQLQLLQTPEALFMVGNLQLYNIKERENEKPMYLVLEQKQQPQATVPEVITKVVVHPNPITDVFNLDFTLAQAVNVQLSIHHLSGVLLHTEHWQGLPAGQQTKTLALNAAPGYYALRLTYGTEVKTTLLIKK